MRNNALHSNSQQCARDAFYALRCIQTSVLTSCHLKSLTTETQASSANRRMLKCRPKLSCALSQLGSTPFHWRCWASPCKCVHVFAWGLARHNPDTAAPTWLARPPRTPTHSAFFSSTSATAASLPSTTLACCKVSSWSSVRPSCVRQPRVSLRSRYFCPRSACLSPVTGDAGTVPLHRRWGVAARTLRNTSANRMLLKVSTKARLADASVSLGGAQAGAGGHCRCRNARTLANAQRSRARRHRTVWQRASTKGASARRWRPRMAAY